MTTTKEEETKVKFATVDPLFTYGVKPGVKGGLYFTKIDTLIYPAGCGISLYSKEKTQELVPLAEKGKKMIRKVVLSAFSRFFSRKTFISHRSK